MRKIVMGAMIVMVALWGHYEGKQMNQGVLKVGLNIADTSVNVAGSELSAPVWGNQYVNTNVSIWEVDIDSQYLILDWGGVYEVSGVLNVVDSARVSQDCGVRGWWSRNGDRVSPYYYSDHVSYKRNEFGYGLDIPANILVFRSGDTLRLRMEGVTGIDECDLRLDQVESYVLVQRI